MSDAQGPLGAATPAQREVAFANHERESEYLVLEFAGVSPSGLTGLWIIRSVSQGRRLGGICWYASWRRYVMTPELGSVWSADCLEVVSVWLEELRDLHAHLCSVPQPPAPEDDLEWLRAMREELGVSDGLYAQQLDAAMGYPIACDEELSQPGVRAMISAYERRLPKTEE